MMLSELRLLVEDGIIRPVDWHFAGLVADRADGADEVVLAALLASWRLGQGDVCVDLRDYAEAELASEIKGTRVSWKLPRLRDWLEKLKKSPAVFVDSGHSCEADGFSVRVPLVLSGSRIYTARYWAYEVALAEALKNFASRETDITPSEVRKILDRLFTASSSSEPDWQKIAVATAVMRHLTIISGGPGTGKTYTVASIILALHLIHGGALRIALAAPTGKAAARMMESIRGIIEHFSFGEELKKIMPDEAMTLHRLIGMREGRSTARHNRENPLPVDVLIIDEASMIDLPMMYRTVSALRPEARLILLGDRNQLASVEAGSVFADLCGSGDRPEYDRLWAEKLRAATGMSVPEGNKKEGLLDNCIVFLRKNYRFSANSSLGRLASAICDGANVENILSGCDSSGDGSVRFRKLEAARFADDLENLAMDWFGGIFSCSSESEALGMFEKSRILCAHREGPFGVSGINRRVEEILTKNGLIKPLLKQYRGRPILITKNDYEVGLFNGDVGIVWPDEKGRLVACFREKDGAVKKISTARLPEHETAFAMTVHKAQGSECDHILFIMPPAGSQILTRELFYTAVTRARRYVEIWGTLEAVVEAVSRRTHRSSGLHERLRGQAICA